ncbi:MAG: Acyltransferase family protein [candidate division TM6 bacterium GW2011_GWF2_28_16]|nr:MAG: Acyltransferase family protein [candidate division TM6 bacterium GW2011_GWF2_28_16]
MLLIDILKNNALNTPNKIAFTMKMGYRTKHFSYKQVYELSQKFALFLKSKNVNKNDKVLIFAPNSPYWGIVFWGTILNGSIIVPVNIQSNTDIIKKIIEQTGAKIIIKSKYLNLEDININIFEIEYLQDYFDNLNIKDFLQENINPSDIIEILYTSGTTGNPKGVLLTHENISSNVLAVSSVIPLKYGQEIILSILPLTHIFEQTIGFFLAQYCCAQVVYAHSYSAIGDLLIKYKITKLLAVPEFLKVLLSKINDKWYKKYFIKLFLKLDVIASGGAFLDPNLEQAWNNLGFTVLQGYGLTETSPVISCNSFKYIKLGSVGKVLNNTQVIINKDNEILVKGPGVFSGYYNNIERTKESFTQDGFFKTGDIGYFDSENFLFIKGRKKYVIIGPNAQNIFPEDIELELNKIPEVKDSCVLGLEKNGVVIIHAVLLLNNNLIKPEDIINIANNNLVSYQKITDYTVWPDLDFPRSATRKVKREDVLAVIKNIVAGKQDYELKIKPSNLIKLLSNISGVNIENININTQIINKLNLDSLMRVELLMRIEQEFGILIDENLITDNLTVQALQNIIDKKESVKKPKNFKKWPRLLCVRIIRNIVQVFIIFLGRIFFKIKIEGFNNIKNLKSQVIFMPNHISYADPFVLLSALPYKIRKKLAFAAAQDVLYKEYKYVAWLAELFANAFALPRNNGDSIKTGLENMGQIIDDGNSVVVFPEGQVSLDGNFLPLKKGAGLMAIEMGLPVIPVKIINSNSVVPYGKLFPKRRDTVVVKFGKAIYFKASDSYEYAKNLIEQEIKKL